MPAFGKHRRPRLGHVSRGFALVGTGGVALTLPLIAPAVAGAAPLSGAPQAAVQAPASPAATITVKAPAAPAAARTYTVVSGDSLSLIAHKKGIQGGWKSLYQANKSVVGDNPSLIRPGLELTIRRDAAKATHAEAKKSAATKRASRSERRATPAVATGTGSSAAAAAPAVAAPSAVKAAPIAATNYADNLDGWIRESLAIMGQRGIPGSYDGIYRNVMRESSGNPQAINLWDSNAVAGTPSKGLLQVIQPTFLAYHVPGTSMDLFDPVANITAACNYAADRYGSIDNVNSAY
ncbi:transglycosylase SLT domain-containing protein [Streptomyces sp. NPDC056362]|uniref:transglycosylase SLT domain-containing protein n=1 Tax=unclassified Streptomyces TaxID=2593676 RepID=UPI0035DA0E49